MLVGLAFADIAEAKLVLTDGLIEAARASRRRRPSAMAATGTDETEPIL